MSWSLEEQAPDILAEMRKARAVTEFHLKATVAEGIKASELIADDRWAGFVRHVEAMAEVHEKVRDGVDARLIRDILTGDAYIKAKYDRATAAGAAWAYRNVIQLIEVLIRDGQSAAAELAGNLTNEEKRSL